MCCDQIVKSLLAFAMVGLAVGAKVDKSQVNTTSLVKPSFQSQMELNWDHTFCNDFEDYDSFPHPDNCKDFLMCWQDEIWEMQCPPGMLFDPWNGWCDDAWYVQPYCLCPPMGSPEVRFFPSHYCDRFYVCINEQRVEVMCRPGQHWNAEKEFCDDPKSAGCDVSIEDYKESRS